MSPQAKTRDRKRINFTLSADVYDHLKEAVSEDELTYTETIRQAISNWLDSRTKRKMAEGYRSEARGNLDMLAEFEHPDRENW